MITVILIIILLALTVIDIILTNKIIALGGKELNPIMSFFMIRLRSFWYLPKLILTVIFILVFLSLPYPFIYLTIWVIIQGIIDTHNIMVYKKQKEKNHG